MTCSENHVTRQIREQGFRLTPQRASILNVLYEAGGHLTAIEVYKKLRARLPNATEPTVYRNLDFLSDNGFIRATQVTGGRAEYEIVVPAHHHLICKTCGQQIQIDHAQVQPFYDRLEQSTGYRLTENHLTFLGYCPHCKSKGE